MEVVDVMNMMNIINIMDAMNTMIIIQCYDNDGYNQHNQI